MEMTNKTSLFPALQVINYRQSFKNYLLIEKMFYFCRFLFIKKVLKTIENELFVQTISPLSNAPAATSKRGWSVS